MVKKTIVRQNRPLSVEKKRGVALASLSQAAFERLDRQAPALVYAEKLTLPGVRQAQNRSRSTSHAFLTGERKQVDLMFWRDVFSHPFFVFNQRFFPITLGIGTTTENRE